MINHEMSRNIGARLFLATNLLLNYTRCLGMLIYKLAQKSIEMGDGVVKMTSLKTLLCILSTTFLFGCSTVERSMSGKIGCPYEEIHILETNAGWGFVGTTWTAQCRNQVYICSLRSGAKSINDIDDMNCARTYSQRRTSLAEDLGQARSESFDEFIDELNEKVEQ